MPPQEASPEASPELHRSPLPASGKEKRSHRAWVYLLQFTVLALFLMGAMPFLAGTQWFMRHDRYPGLRNFGYSQRAGRLNCEVLIYGDSSSLTGMDPSIIQSMTGLKTCNVAEGATIQSVVGSDIPLQTYLKQNVPPRFLVGTWTPSHFDPDYAPYTEFYPEGYVYAMQFGTLKESVRHLLKKPKWSYKFSIWVLQALQGEFVDALRGKNRHPIDARAQRDARMGQWPYPIPPETHCVRPDMTLNPNAHAVSQESIAAFRRKYASPQTTVLIDIAPVPECDRSFEIYARETAGLPDNAFEKLPISSFNEGDVHFSAEGARHVSEVAARQILARMHQP